MKLYIHANTSKPKLDHVRAKWQELDDGSGIEFFVYSEDNDVLFEELFDYSDVDSDAIYDSAVDMAVIALSQKYELSDKVIDEIKGAAEDE